MKTVALYSAKRSGKHHERAGKDNQDSDNVRSERRHIILQRDFVIHDVICKDTRGCDGKGEEQNSKEPLCLTDKPQAASLIGMRWKELQVEPANTRKKLKPEKEPPKPS